MKGPLATKVLLAVAGAEGDRGLLQSALESRFASKRRGAASAQRALDEEVAALVADGLIEEVERGRGARALRVTAAGREALLSLRYDGGPLARSSFTGRQLEEAVRPLRAEIESLHRALAGLAAEMRRQRSPGRAGVPASAGASQGVSPDDEARAQGVLGAARAIEARDRPPGRLVPIHQVRDEAGLDPPAFDAALWRLAKAGHLTLHKRNDEGAVGEAERRASFYHPFTGKLLYYLRPQEGGS